MTVLLLDDGAFVEIARYGAGQTLTSSKLAGFTANLDDISSGNGKRCCEPLGALRYVSPARATRRPSPRTPPGRTRITATMSTPIMKSGSWGRRTRRAGTASPSRCPKR